MIVAGALLAFALASPVTAPPGTTTATAGCADFLGAMHHKPAHLDFVGCTYRPGQQGKPLHATYRVAGRYAAATEDFLVHAVGLPRLKRSCCQWDAPPHGFTDARGHAFTITMVSDDTSVATRAAWPRIKMFEVTVETLTEDI